MNKDNTIGFGIGLLTGVVIGGVIALLLSPRSGKENRQLIKDKATEMLDSVREKADGASDTIKNAASETGRKGQAAIHALKN